MTDPKKMLELIKENSLYSCIVGLLAISFILFLVNLAAGTAFLKCIHISDNPVIHDIMVRMPDYTDVFIAVYIAVIVALLTITITMFVFLKSALDRVIDENEYVSYVASIYQDNSSIELLVIALFNILPIILSIGWHFSMQFMEVHLLVSMFGGLITLAFASLLVIYVTIAFWSKCIDVRRQLNTETCKRISSCDEEMSELLSYICNCRLSGTITGSTDRDGSDINDYSRILFLIGYWYTWETEDMDDVICEQVGSIDFFEDDSKVEPIVRCGVEICKNLVTDQYINLFSRIEDFLLAGGQKNEDNHVGENDIITIIQERKGILEPIIGKNSNVEANDFGERFYEIDKKDRGPVISYIKEFRQLIGYDDNSNNGNKEFYDTTEKMYRLLRKYRNLKLSERYSIHSERHESRSTLLKKSVHEEESYSTTQKESDFSQGYLNNRIDENMAIGLYYFLLRVLGVFVSSVHIEDMTFNGNVLSFANFYNSSLEKVNLYSTQFYHTVFTRTRLVQAVLDLSQFDNIYFYNTRITNSSINNATFDHVMFENVQANHSGFNIGIFTKSDFNDCEFENCFFNKSKFLGCKLWNVDFNRAVLSDNEFSNTEMKNCSFNGAKIKNWKWNNGLTWEDYWIWEDNWKNNEKEKRKKKYPPENLKAYSSIIRNSQHLDMSFSDFQGAIIEGGIFTGTEFKSTNFSEATMVQSVFINCKLANTLFTSALLPNARFISCDEIIRSSFNEANLFEAEFYDCNLEKSSFSFANAGNSTFDKCNLQYSNCAEISLKEALVNDVKFNWSLLYNATLSWAGIYNSSFNNSIADHMQFTFAKCEQDSFDFSTMFDTNFSGTVYKHCSFLGTAMNRASAYNSTFDRCTFVHTDFSESRFVKSLFTNLKEDNSENGECSCSNFRNCTFEECTFNHFVIENCELSGTVFMDCEFDNVEIRNCTLSSSEGAVIVNNAIFSSLCRRTKKEGYKVICSDI